MISGGRLRGVRLAVPPGLSTRPTRGRVREALFSIVAEHLPGARVADLYAGSGALGLEALSRGAAHATFVERGAPALACLRRNIAACRLAPGEYELLITDAQVLAPRQPFDLVLADPPFALRDPLPPALLRPGALASGGLLVLEQPGERIAPLRLGALELRASRSYGDTSSLWIYAPSVTR
ncbi:MAG TPA: 16S rRNA (guanine(966)-N(2))-methyltransferase RsmD [Planctomycetota bacterium]|nr:16S rRNA (guanine(966)-N(2))-methyltransferase RsmD [Planctomycetota bacterium]